MTVKGGGIIDPCGTNSVLKRCTECGMEWFADKPYRGKRKKKGGV
jgi:hypothetical protein